MLKSSLAESIKSSKGKFKCGFFESSVFYSLEYMSDVDAWLVFSYEKDFQSGNFYRNPENKFDSLREGIQFMENQVKEFNFPS